MCSGHGLAGELQWEDQGQMEAEETAGGVQTLALQALGRMGGILLGKYTKPK